MRTRTKVGVVDDVEIDRKPNNSLIGLVSFSEKQRFPIHRIAFIYVSSQIKTVSTTTPSLRYAVFRMASQVTEDRKQAPTPVLPLLRQLSIEHRSGRIDGEQKSTIKDSILEHVYRGADSHIPPSATPPLIRQISAVQSNHPLVSLLQQISEAYRNGWIDSDTKSRIKSILAASTATSSTLAAGEGSASTALTASTSTSVGSKHSSDTAIAAATKLLRQHSSSDKKADKPLKRMFILSSDTRQLTAATFWRGGSTTPEATALSLDVLRAILLYCKSEDILCAAAVSKGWERAVCGGSGEGRLARLIAERLMNQSGNDVRQMITASLPPSEHG